MPNIAVIESIRKRYGKNHPPEILYVGGRNGMEKGMMEKLGIPYKGIYCGKLRRYFSFSNLFDVFRTAAGIIQSFFIVARFRPDAVFCKGGYVSFPVAVGAWLARKRVYLHESDVIPGLANRLSARFATKIFVSFEESKKYFHRSKVVLTGNPVRSWLAEGSRTKGRQMTGLKENLPVLLVVGGSQGAGFINDVVWDNLPELLAKHQIVHICGKGKMKSKPELLKSIGHDDRPLLKRYFSLEFADAGLKDLYALCSLVISRAGANTLAEIAFIHRPAILIPLGLDTSRGDQIVNAKVFASGYPAIIINEDSFDKKVLFETIGHLLEVKPEMYGESMNAAAADKIVDIITSQ